VTRRWHTVGVGGGDTLYEILDVDPSADDSQIKAAYRRMIRQVHPDQGGSHALFRQVQEAYDTLRDQRRRAEYDESLRRRGRSDRDWKRDHNEPKSSGEQSQGWPPPPPPGWTSGYPPPPSGGRAQSTPPPPPAPASKGSWVSTHPLGTIALAGFALLIFASSLHSSAVSFLALGALVVAGLAALGRRRHREQEAFRRSGIDAVDVMGGTDFERLLGELFAWKGYAVRHVGGRGDFGADLVLDGPEGRAIVQAKRWSQLVNHKAVQEVVAAKAPYGANRAVVVTNSSFTDHAKQLARTNAVELWDRTRLARELSIFSSIPPRSGASQLASQVGAGVAVSSSALFAFLLAVGKSKPRSRRPARRVAAPWWPGGRRVRVRSHTRRVRHR
jgi:restriction system protein